MSPVQFFLLFLRCKITTSTLIEVTCDIIIAGGNTGALSAAITAAESAQYLNETISICLLEPTDFYGGQMTAQGVSAIDYGHYNVDPQNQGKSFKELIDSLYININPGDCAVSVDCYQPQNLMNDWILPKLSNLSEYITVYNRTVVISSSCNLTTKRIESVTAVQRIPVTPNEEWTYFLSQQLEDWYNPHNSSLFNKISYKFIGNMFIEGSEFGDIQMNLPITHYQGIESPNENSTTCNDQCGQAMTFTFFVKLLPFIPDNPPIIPPGNNENESYSYSSHSWNDAWIYRRAYDSIAESNYSNINASEQVNYNDITQQNWGGTNSKRKGNDYDIGYILLPLDIAKNQSINGWKGGVNITALSQAEQRALGWFHYFINTSNMSNMSVPFKPEQLIMDLNCTGTSFGLSKFPYLRDARRATGLNGFRMNHSTMLGNYNQTSNSSNHYVVGYKFHDTVAIGNYDFDMHLLYECIDNHGYPPYLPEKNTGNVPFYIPFRSISSGDFNNLLFVGKNIAVSFYGNAATREHPAEWNTGVAGGALAQYMLMLNISDTMTVYEEIGKFQQYLHSDFIQQPMDWN